MKYALDTLGIHAGEPTPRVQGAAVFPIFQSATYEFDASASLGYDDVKYARCNNTPAHESLNAKIAALHGAEAAMITSSGMAAITTTLLTFVKSGEHIMAQSALYGGTFSALTHDFADLGITHTLVSAENPAQWAAALRPETKVFYSEAITNPLLEVADHKAIVAFAKENGLVSIIDNTFASPVNFRPLEIGYDIVVESATKYLGGHSDLIAGVYLGTKEHVRRITSKLNHLGGTLDPHCAFLLQRSIKTLGVRVRQQNANAMALATFLKQQPQIAKVIYPGLPSHPAHGRAQELFKQGFGGMLAFEVKGGVAAAKAFLAALTLPLEAPSLGGVESLITRPATTTHVGMTATQREAAGISDGTVRLSVGIEDQTDLLADFSRACTAADAAPSGPPAVSADHVQRFETIAGRSAMVGFVVACGAELMAPAHGLFGACTGEDVSLFAALALSIVCAAGVLATQNKRRLGLKLREAVTASLTALRGSMAGVQGREVDSAVDFVFDTVFSRDLIASFLIEDEYI